MPSRLRSNACPKISFFSFQDIITSVTGILTLVTLILTLYIEPPKTSAPGEESLQQQLDAALDELAKASAANEATRARQTAADAAPDPERLQAEIREWQDQVQAFSNQLVSLRLSTAQQIEATRQRSERLGLAEVRERAETAERELRRREQSNEQLRAQTSELENAEQELKVKTDAATNEPKLWLLPPQQNADSLQPLLITLSGSGLTWQRFQNSTNRQTLPAADLESGFAAALRDWKSDRDYLVFYVRPSGIALFERCRAMAREVGFKIGYDALEESRELVVSPPPRP
jgi:hypothetical protein